MLGLKERVFERLLLSVAEVLLCWSVVSSGQSATQPALTTTNDVSDQGLGFFAYTEVTIQDLSLCADYSILLDLYNIDDNNDDSQLSFYIRMDPECCTALESLSDNIAISSGLSLTVCNGNDDTDLPNTEDSCVLDFDDSMLDFSDDCTLTRFELWMSNSDGSNSDSDSSPTLIGQSERVNLQILAALSDRTDGEQSGMVVEKTEYSVRNVQLRSVVRSETVSDDNNGECEYHLLNLEVVYFTDGNKLKVGGQDELTVGEICAIVFSILGCILLSAATAAYKKVGKCNGECLLKFMIYTTYVCIWPCVCCD